MATFLPYASCYGNKSAPQMMGPKSRDFSSFLGKPPCLIKRRKRQTSPASDLSLFQLTQLIRSLRQLPYQDEPQDISDRLSVVTKASSSSCHPKIFGNHCLFCIHHHHHKQAG